MAQKDGKQWPMTLRASLDPKQLLRHVLHYLPLVWMSVTSFLVVDAFHLLVSSESRLCSHDICNLSGLQNASNNSKNLCEINKLPLSPNRSESCEAAHDCLPYRNCASINEENDSFYGELQYKSSLGEEDITAMGTEHCRLHRFPFTELETPMFPPVADAAVLTTNESATSAGSYSRSTSNRVNNGSGGRPMTGAGETGMNGGSKSEQRRPQSPKDYLEQSSQDAIGSIGEISANIVMTTSSSRVSGGSTNGNQSFAADTSDNDLAGNGENTRGYGGTTSSCGEGSYAKDSAAIADGKDNKGKVNVNSVSIHGGSSSIERNGNGTDSICDPNGSADQVVEDWAGSSKSCCNPRDIAMVEEVEHQIQNRGSKPTLCVLNTQIIGTNGDHSSSGETLLSIFICLLLTLLLVATICTALTGKMAENPHQHQHRKGFPFVLWPAGGDAALPGVAAAAAATACAATWWLRYFLQWLAAALAPHEHSSYQPEPEQFPCDNTTNDGRVDQDDVAGKQPELSHMCETQSTGTAATVRLQPLAPRGDRPTGHRGSLPIGHAVDGNGWSDGGGGSCSGSNGDRRRRRGLSSCSMSDSSPAIKQFDSSMAVASTTAKARATAMTGASAKDRGQVLKIDQTTEYRGAQRDPRTDSDLSWNLDAVLTLSSPAACTLNSLQQKQQDQVHLELPLASPSTTTERANSIGDRNLTGGLESSSTFASGCCDVDMADRKGGGGAAAAAVVDLNRHPKPQSSHSPLSEMTLRLLLPQGLKAGAASSVNARTPLPPQPPPQHRPPPAQLPPTPMPLKPLSQMTSSQDATPAPAPVGLRAMAVVEPQPTSLRPSRITIRQRLQQLINAEGHSPLCEVSQPLNFLRPQMAVVPPPPPPPPPDRWRPPLQPPEHVPAVLTSALPMVSKMDMRRAMEGVMVGRPWDRQTLVPLPAAKASQQLLVSPPPPPPPRTQPTHLQFISQHLQLQPQPQKPQPSLPPLPQPLMEGSAQCSPQAGPSWTNLGKPGEGNACTDAAYATVAENLNALISDGAADEKATADATASSIKRDVIAIPAVAVPDSSDPMLPERQAPRTPPLGNPQQLQTTRDPEAASRSCAARLLASAGIQMRTPGHGASTAGGATSAVACAYASKTPVLQEALIRTASDTMPPSSVLAQGPSAASTAAVSSYPSARAPLSPPPHLWPPPLPPSVADTRPNKHQSVGLSLADFASPPATPPISSPMASPPPSPQPGSRLLPSASAAPRAPIMLRKDPRPAFHKLQPAQQLQKLESQHKRQQIGAHEAPQEPAEPSCRQVLLPQVPRSSWSGSDSNQADVGISFKSRNSSGSGVSSHGGGLGENSTAAAAAAAVARALQGLAGMSDPVSVNGRGRFVPAPSAPSPSPQSPPDANAEPEVAALQRAATRRTEEIVSEHLHAMTVHVTEATGMTSLSPPPFELIDSTEVSAFSAATASPDTMATSIAAAQLSPPPPPSTTTTAGEAGVPIVVAAPLALAAAALTDLATTEAAALTRSTSTVAESKAIDFTHATSFQTVADVMAAGFNAEVEAEGAGQVGGWNLAAVRMSVSSPQRTDRWPPQSMLAPTMDLGTEPMIEADASAGGLRLLGVVVSSQASSSAVRAAAVADPVMQGPTSLLQNLDQSATVSASAAVMDDDAALAAVADSVADTLATGSATGLIYSNHLSRRSFMGNGSSNINITAFEYGRWHSSSEHGSNKMFGGSRSCSDNHDGDDDESCFICLERRSQFAFAHASGVLHVGVCRPCLPALEARGWARTCPLCRQEIIAMRDMQVPRR